jgi:hypothetical protein
VKARLDHPRFCPAYGLPVGKVRRAVKCHEIETVTFAGLERITPSEARRVAKLFGLKPSEDND